MSAHSPPAEALDDADNFFASKAAPMPSGCTAPEMPLHMFTFSSTTISSPTPRSKRRQVKNACTSCQRACKKCDDARPCLRCVKYGTSDECVDSARKERKKGMKRGPYKKRNGNVDDNDPPTIETPITKSMHHVGIPGTTGAPPPMIGNVGYPPAFYGQLPQLVPTSATIKLGEIPAFYPHIYMLATQDGSVAHASPQFYPATYMSYAPPYAYMVRPEGQMMVVPPLTHMPHVMKSPPMDISRGDPATRRD